jgi:predicted RNA binding protein with dsRBD fold (UPF0201 family)
MKIKESESDQYGTFITGLAYTGVLGIVLLLFCFVINENWFDYTVTFILIAIICIVFFISGLKKVEEKNIGFLQKLGRRNFEESYSEGLWWIFPIWSFKQKPHFDLLNEAEELQVKFITSDEIPLDINVKYYWQLKNLKDIDNRFSASYIKDKLKHELGIFVRNRQAIELLSDEDISNKVMVNYLVSAGERIGIAISDVFPNINFENQYIPVVRKYQEKYKDLQFQLDEMLKHQQIKAADMKLYENQIVNCINNLGFSANEAMNFIKVYKNQVNMSESTYNIGELNKVIDSVMSFFKK